MRVFITVLVLIFSLQSWTRADDIRAFEIEGMSIGDSLLDFYSEELIIESFQKSRYKDKSFIRLEFLKGFEFYDGVQIHVKRNDSKYIIEMIGGAKFYVDDIEACYKQQKLVVNDLKNNFKDAIFSEMSLDKHPVDKTGKSTVASINAELENLDMVSIQCYDWSKTEVFNDLIKIKLMTSEYVYWIRNIAYK